MSRKPFAMVALSLAFVVTLNACGSDSDSDDTVADATTTEVSDVSAASTPDPTTEVATPDATTAEVSSPDTTIEVASTDATTTPTADPGVTDSSGVAQGGEVCTALKVISDYDADSNEVIAGNPTFAELQAFLTDTAPSVLQAYDDAAAADPDLASDATTLKEFTGAAVEAFANADTQEEATAAITTIPNVQAAGAAGQRLNEYATTNCGFSTSSALG